MRTLCATLLLLLATACIASAQSIRGVVVDDTGLLLPGVSMRLLDAGEAVLAVSTTTADGTFELDAVSGGTAVQASLDGFAPTTVAAADAATIVLHVAASRETVTVVAEPSTPASPVAPLLARTLTTVAVERTSTQMRPRDSLPLLPSVVRGPDGLLRVGGAAAHETPLIIDGFNVTDPATGLSSISLPLESVATIEVRQDPVSVSDGDLIGGMTSMETRAGNDHRFKMGLQGVLPRPRLKSPQFGRVEDFSPRIYAQGSTPGGGVRYLGEVSYAYDRIPIPGVTDVGGPNLTEVNTTAFGRVDLQTTSTSLLTVETILVPTSVEWLGLSPRRDAAASPDLKTLDGFLGATWRFAARSGTLTLRASHMARHTSLTPTGTGASVLTPDGWHDNWFTRVRRDAERDAVGAQWESTVPRHPHHVVTFVGGGSARSLDGSVAESPVIVEDANGRVVRRIAFGPPAALSAADRRFEAAARDLWTPNARFQFDGGLRVDASTVGGTVPSARVGVRASLTASGDTVVKASIGRFVSDVSLDAQTFGQYPMRTETLISSVGDATTRAVQPTRASFEAPRATAIGVTLEQRLGASLDAQVSVTDRRSSKLATIGVPDNGGAFVAGSTGSGLYRALELSVRRTWLDSQQLFVGYVRSLSRRDTNDFATLFQQLDDPLLQSGTTAPALTDAPHRLITWGTFNLPLSSVVSPIVEWRSGFPYSSLTAQYLYAGAPNSQRFPAFFSADVVVYKSFHAFNRTADFGVQLFNLTGHQNPRDVYPVVGTPRFGGFTNSTGVIVRGYMNLKWK